MIKLHHLRDFVAIATEKSIRSAARSLNLAQPALSRSLSELESRLGTPLVERHARGIVLTQAGDRFLIRANATLLELQRGIDEVAFLSGDDSGTVNVGMSTAVMLSIVPSVYRQFRRIHRETKLRFVEATFGSVESQLQGGQMDMYIGLRPPLPLGTSFRLTTLFENKRAVYCRLGHPLANAERLGDLLDADWIFPGPSSRRVEELTDIFETHGLIAPKIKTCSDSMLGVLMLLMKTDAVAILPVQWTTAFGTLQLIAPMPIKENLCAPDIVMITKTASPLTPLAETFATLVEKEVNQTQPLI